MLKFKEEKCIVSNIKLQMNNGQLVLFITNFFCNFNSSPEIFSNSIQDSHIFKVSLKTSQVLFA